MFRHKVHCWRWLRAVKQAVTVADELNLAYRLRQRQIVKSRETNPITNEWQAVAEHQGEFRFLRIAQASIVEIELPGRVLVGNLKARRLEKKILQVIIFDRRLLVQLDHRRLFCNRDFCPRHFRHDLLTHLAPIIVRRGSRNRLTGDSDLSCFGRLSRTRLPCGEKQNQYCQDDQPRVIAK
jgi:hypothetical protein